MTHVMTSFKWIHRVDLWFHVSYENVCEMCNMISILYWSVLTSAKWGEHINAKYAINRLLHILHINLHISAYFPCIFFAYLTNTVYIFAYFLHISFPSPRVAGACWRGGTTLLPRLCRALCTVCWVIADPVASRAALSSDGPVIENGGRLVGSGHWPGRLTSPPR